MRRRLEELDAKMQRHHQEKGTARLGEMPGLAAREPVGGSAGKSGRGRVYLAITAAVFVAGYFLWPGPLLRERWSEQQRQEKIIAAIQEEAERIRVDKARKAEIAAASEGELRSLIGDCKRQIIAENKQSPFEVYFPDYGAADLRKFASAGAVFDMPLGRPSTVLEGFDAEAYNLKRLREEQVDEIEFVIEGAMDSFNGAKRYAGIYQCQLNGMNIIYVVRDDIFMLD